MLLKGIAEISISKRINTQAYPHASANFTTSLSNRFTTIDGGRLSKSTNYAEVSLASLSPICRRSQLCDYS